jgi:hypothetical protein
MVSPEKIKLVPEFTILHPVVAMVMVPPDGLNVAVDELVNAPFMVKEEDVVTVAPEAIVRLLKVRVPELAIEEPVFMVIVPADGDKLPPLTFNAAFISKLLEVAVVPVTVKLLNTKLEEAPPLLVMVPPVIVIVPAVGAKVLVELTVKAPETEKEEVG